MVRVQFAISCTTRDGEEGAKENEKSKKDGMQVLINRKERKAKKEPIK
jgi:hypothetical protein